MPALEGGGPLVASSAVILVLVAWAVAATVIFWIEVSVSVASTADLVVHAVVMGAPAAWLVPALLLLGVREEPLPALLGLLLVVNTVRLLFARVSPKRLRRHRAEGQDAPGMFAAARMPVGFLSTAALAVLAGSLAMQFGLIALLCGLPLAAAVLCSAGTAVWTRTAVRRGAHSGHREARIGRVTVHALPALLLAAWLAGSGYTTGDIQTDSFVPATAGLARRLVYAPKKEAKKREVKAQTAGQRVTELASTGRSVDPAKLRGIPGVILRPEVKAKPKARIVPPRVSFVPFSLSQPLTIPFSGEYRIYRTSSGGLPSNAAVEPGTPIEVKFRTTNGSSMTTEAVQHLSPPVDLSNCAAIRVVISSREIMPTIVRLHLVLAVGELPLGRELPLGEEAIFPQVNAPTQPGSYTLQYEVPARGIRPVAAALRVLLRRGLGEDDQNAAMAVEGFTLVPRGL